MKQELNFDLEINEITRDYLEQITKDIQREVRWETPINTGTLVENIDISKVEYFNGGLSQKVFTDLDKVSYAGYVEGGVMGKKYTYHINGIQFKEGVGARMYEEIFKNYQKSLGSILK